MKPNIKGQYWSFFLASAIASALVLGACDSGTSATPATGKDRGEAVFKRYCNVCHPGGNAGSGPSLVSLAPRLTDDQITSLVRHGKTRMPGYSQSDISDADLVDLVSYIRSLK